MFAHSDGNIAVHGLSSNSSDHPIVEPWSHLQGHEAQTIKLLCNSFPKVLTKQLGITNLLEYEIKLVDKSYVKSHPYQLAPPKMDLLREEVESLLHKGVITPSCSQYASPAFLVPKPSHSVLLLQIGLHCF